MSSDYSLTPQVERKAENRARLVVLVEKRHAQRSRVEPESEVELIPVDFTLDGLRESFKNMQKAVSSPIKTELKGVGESNWYQTIGSCLAYASMCAELIQHSKPCTTENCLRWTYKLLLVRVHFHIIIIRDALI